MADRCKSKGGVTFCTRVGVGIGIGLAAARSSATDDDSVAGSNRAAGAFWADTWRAADHHDHDPDDDDDVDDDVRRRRRRGGRVFLEFCNLFDGDQEGSLTRGRREGRRAAVIGGDGGGAPPLSPPLPPPPPPAFASISSAFGFGHRKSTLFFARMAPFQQQPPRPPSPTRARSSHASKKVEHYGVRRVVGDGRCMFRALVLGMAANKGLMLSGAEEESEADQLRMAVYDAICTSEKRRKVYEESLIAITLDESLKMYCNRIQRPSFWGGEAELLVLSRMCATPIIVYIPEHMAKARQGQAGAGAGASGGRGGGAKWGSGFIAISEYGAEFAKASKDRKARNPVRLLFNGVNHYDLLL